jgi:soluble lytic murein transglycosylase-like protein
LNRLAILTNHIGAKGFRFEEILMRTLNIRVALAVISAIAVLPAQTPADGQTGMDAALAKQRASAPAMEESLARQRSSVAKQTSQADRGGFFVLPPPTKLGAAAAAAFTATAADCEPLPASEIDSLVGQAARRQDLDEAVLRGVIQQESAFRPCAVSPKGAMGLMQLMPATASDLGVRNPFDPAANLDAGAMFLKELLMRYGGDLSLALGAYNAGPARVDAAGSVPAIPETQDYVKRILSALPVKK